MEMIGFRIDEKIKKRLEKIAKKERRPLANLIRIIVEDWLEEYEKSEK
jgi:predicted DNA-binding protein